MLALSETKKIGISIALIAGSFGFILFQLFNFSTNASLDDWASGFEGYFKSTRLQTQTGKPMAIFFYTDWCPNCKKLRETILSTDEVSSFMQNFHAVKINPEYGALEQQIADNYQVKGYPTILVVDAKSENAVPILRTANITPAQFIEQLDEAGRQLHIEFKGATK